LIEKPSTLLMVVTAALVAVALGRAGAQEIPVRVPAGELKPLDADVVCPVGGMPHRSRLHAARYRGRIYYTCDAAALERFLRNPRDFVSDRTPSAGWFRSPNPAGPVTGVWLFLIGVYVVLGLVSGAIAAYVAVQKGLGGGRWFAAGLALNVIGVALAVARPGRAMPFTRRGLAKIPTTHAPVACTACGQPNHPSATRCGGCGAGLEPSVESEVARAKKGGG